MMHKMSMVTSIGLGIVLRKIYWTLHSKPAQRGKSCSKGSN